MRELLFAEIRSRHPDGRATLRLSRYHPAFLARREGDKRTGVQSAGRGLLGSRYRGHRLFSCEPAVPRPPREWRSRRRRRRRHHPRVLFSAGACLRRRGSRAPVESADRAPERPGESAAVLDSKSPGASFARVRSRRPCGPPRSPGERANSLANGKCCESV